MEFAEREVLCYYKCIVKDQSESIEQLKSEIVCLENLSVEYRGNKEQLEKDVEALNQEIGEFK